MKFICLEKNGKTESLWFQQEGTRLWIHYQGTTWIWDSKSQQNLLRSSTEEQPLKTSLFSPMTGRILKISVKKGDKVTKSQTLLILSAMKMEYIFRAEADGKVKRINCKEEDTVSANQLLIEMDYA